MSDVDLEFVEEEDAVLEARDVAAFSDAVLYSSDWTVQTVISQLINGNIDMNPRFQRRDAWSPGGKGRFIESVILGFPIPQIVLAEKKGQRGQFIVLDGKQRLLTLLQFTGNAQGPKNAFRLSGLEVRDDLNRKTFTQLERDPSRRDDLNAFFNNTIRTVVIRNWPNTSFLHTVFLRLNTGSVKLSPQELRQAMVPGPFSDFIDDTALASTHVQLLMGRTTPDPRMRDVELLVRYLGFRRFLPVYAGRMKEFLDQTCFTLNGDWPIVEQAVANDLLQFDAGVDALVEIFGPERLARKPGSSSFNRAIFDALIFYAADPVIRVAMIASPDAVRDLYSQKLDDLEFSESVESDTAGIPHTYDRIFLWGFGLKTALNADFHLPALEQRAEATMRITFNGFH
ncbi:DUF262 domain-containing protein [Rhizobium leguminosarum]|uniref:DUF262 domain-containing protein n=1 Tax=Rhizobium leguminosarum TaxID=384 RepID=A0A6P0BHX4_RHILE|nr:DUF262 domain-containing protein [Rhizobium leguminosarum]MBY5441804.1 DUF262 domain-containing protein [Rhizobium leguminosarum]NEI39048.1 DUF262 domain-containing protein [Rhizobium leguminosarum]NEI45791.1 DUF262 domain-containing protein [Rhizobium leguminosarum]